MASVEWSGDALQDLERIDAVIAERVILKVSWLRENFSTVVPERLKRDLKGLYKLRVGDYRAVYSLHGEKIIIEGVGHRSEVYRNK
jgi:mRNA interferase RelE/StbE